MNPYGVHFQPQVPGTEQGPMMHRYMPRHDFPGAPGMFMPGHQMSGYHMVSALVGLCMSLIDVRVIFLLFTSSHVARNMHWFEFGLAEHSLISL